MGELQDRRDAQTRAELSATAIALFAKHGYGETTMDEVAKATGVSRRTAYRHFANKEDLIFEETRLWLETFDATVATRQAGESLRAVCERAVLDVAAFIEQRKEAVLAGAMVVLATPALTSRYARTNREWLEAYVALLLSDTPAPSAELTTQASVIAGAIVGGTDAAVALWAIDDSTTVVERTASVLDQIDPLWPAAFGSR